MNSGHEAEASAGRENRGPAIAGKMTTRLAGCAHIFGTGEMSVVLLQVAKGSVKLGSQQAKENTYAYVQ